MSGRLAHLRIGGTPFEVGHALGRFGADTLHAHARESAAWATVMRWRGHPWVTAMAAAVRARQPDHWQELLGLATGLAMPADDVFLWNCRGDLWAMAPDGCTTLQCPGPRPLVAHNEDGDPAFAGRCAVAEVSVAGGGRFASFVYPGSLPGHAFAANGEGLVMTVNNLRLPHAAPGLPRILVTRALLDARSVAGALAYLETVPRAGGFHLTLAQAGEALLTSVEFSDARISAVPLTRWAVHANHTVHPAMADQAQVVTGSSAHRQQRGDELMRHCAAAHQPPDPLAVLFDRGDTAFPIYRDAPDDADCENTLATAVFLVGEWAVDWSIHVGGAAEPVFTMRDAVRR